MKITISKILALACFIVSIILYFNFYTINYNKVQNDSQQIQSLFYAKNAFEKDNGTFKAAAYADYKKYRMVLVTKNNTPWGMLILEKGIIGRYVLRTNVYPDFKSEDKKYIQVIQPFGIDNANFIIAYGDNRDNRLSKISLKVSSYTNPVAAEIDSSEPYILKIIDTPDEFFYSKNPTMTLYDKNMNDITNSYSTSEHGHEGLWNGSTAGETQFPTLVYFFFFLSLTFVLIDVVNYIKHKKHLQDL